MQGVVFCHLLLLHHQHMDQVLTLIATHPHHGLSNSLSKVGSCKLLLEYVIPPAPAPSPKKTHVMVLACVNGVQSIIMYFEG